LNCGGERRRRRLPALTRLRNPDQLHRGSKRSRRRHDLKKGPYSTQKGGPDSMRFDTDCVYADQMAPETSFLLAATAQNLRKMAKLLPDITP
jgi:hypothetical protein